MSRLLETEAFVAVVRERSFSGGGERLGISSSYASKLVSKLEARLGATLLHRTTRKLTLTEAGAGFYQKCSAALELVETAEEDVAALDGTPRGRLRVSLPAGLGLAWLTCAVADFAAANPSLVMDVVYLDRFVDIVAEGFDVAIRVGVLDDSSMIARRLAHTRRGLVASPAFLERHGAPASPEELRERPCVAYSYHQAPTTWALWPDGDLRQEPHRVQVTGPLVANSGQALCDAAARGLGIAYVPDFHVARRVADGSLVRVLEGWGARVPIQALYPAARHVPAKVRCFIEFMVRHLREPPWEAAAKGA